MPLSISNPRERAIVGIADAVLSAVRLATRPFGRRAHGEPRRILLLRLERIGDLLMTLDAIAAVRRLAPTAEIDLIVGSWNRALAEMLDGPTRIETLDAPWLARDPSTPLRTGPSTPLRTGPTATLGAGAATSIAADPPNLRGEGPSNGASLRAMFARAVQWRRRRYDLAINFEGDIRTNVLLALTGAPRRIGFGMAGGGAALTDVVSHDARLHTRTNALRLVQRAFGERAAQGVLAAIAESPSRLHVPDAARSLASERLGLPSDRQANPAGLPRAESSTSQTESRGLPRAESRGPFIGLHVSSGRAIKQWDLDRFASVGQRLAREIGATIVLTGSDVDRPMVDAVKRMLGREVSVKDLCGVLDLPALAAVLERLDLLITGDTGPMHLAAAVGTPVVAVFGPSDPARYAPVASAVVRVDLPCSPCNRIRLPPARCVGHTPDCLTGVSVDAVYDAALALLSPGRPGTPRFTPLRMVARS